MIQVEGAFATRVWTERVAEIRLGMLLLGISETGPYLVAQLQKEVGPRVEREHPGQGGQRQQGQKGLFLTGHQDGCWYFKPLAPGAGGQWPLRGLAG